MRRSLSSFRRSGTRGKGERATNSGNQQELLHGDLLWVGLKTTLSLADQETLGRPLRCAPLIRGSDKDKRCREQKQESQCCYALSEHHQSLL
jgi:hypothetical protein